MTRGLASHSNSDNQPINPQHRRVAGALRRTLLRGRDVVYEFGKFSSRSLFYRRPLSNSLCLTAPPEAGV